MSNECPLCEVKRRMAQKSPCRRCVRSMRKDLKRAVKRSMSHSGLLRHSGLFGRPRSKKYSGHIEHSDSMEHSGRMKRSGRRSRSRSRR